MSTAANAITIKVTPFVGVWIETGDNLSNYIKDKSHPSWVCGLKHLLYELREILCQSHPSWVCGLKLISHLGNLTSSSVTPFVGVWIETANCWNTEKPLQRHTLRGCVD